MRRASLEAIDRAARDHAAVDWETDPERLAQLWKVRIIPGREDSATHGPPSIITRRRDSYAPRQRFTMHHEHAHILIQKYGLEDAIKEEVDEDDAQAHLEAVVNWIAAMLVMPDIVVEQVIKQHGMTPLAILELQAQARVSFAAAMRRFAFSDVDRPTTVVLCGENYILDLASTDPYNRLHRYQRMPDARAALPHAELLTIPDHYRPRTIGVVTW